MKKNIINKINYLIQIVLIILTALLSLFVIYMLISKLSGYSPDMITIVAWTVGILLTLQIVIISILFPMKGTLGKLEEFKEQMQSFKEQTINEVNKIKKKIKL